MCFFFLFLFIFSGQDMCSAIPAKIKCFASRATTVFKCLVIGLSNSWICYLFACFLNCGTGGPYLETCAHMVPPHFTSWCVHSIINLTISFMKSHPFATIHVIIIYCQQAGGVIDWVWTNLTHFSCVLLFESFCWGFALFLAGTQSLTFSPFNLEKWNLQNQSRPSGSPPSFASKRIPL